MPAKDKYHDAVVNALQKDGWTILNEQVTLRFDEHRLWIDLQARNIQREVILVEVKSYENIASPITFLHSALGQYLLYRAILEDINSQADLYLAVPKEAYAEIFQAPIGELIIARYQLNIVVYDSKEEVTVEWIQQSET